MTNSTKAFQDAGTGIADEGNERPDYAIGQTLYLKAGIYELNPAEGTYSMRQGIPAGTPLKLVQEHDTGAMVEFLEDTGAQKSGAQRSIVLRDLTDVKPTAEEIQRDAMLVIQCVEARNARTQQPA